jgi:hypothetical protein
MLTQYAVMAVFCRADQRRHHIDQMWAPDGRVAVSSLRLTTEGVDDINAHISQVHDDLIATKDSPSPTTNTSSPATACCCLVDARAERRELTELLKRLTPGPRRLAARAVGPELHLGH